MSNKVAAVIIDLDGTLIDSMGGFFDMVIDGLEKKGVRYSEEILSKIGNDLLEDFQSVPAKRGIGLVFKIFWKIGRKAQLSRLNTIIFSLECVSKARKIYYNAPLFPDVKDSLTHLKSTGFELGVYTLASRPQLEAVLSKHNIKHFFNPSSIISRDDVENIKPDPEGVLLALEGCSVNPLNGFFLGDMPADIIAGTRAGVTTVAITTGLVNEKTFNQYSQPNKVFDSLTQATHWIIETKK
jgi:phosphoglycolate phosphatase-like HAD superfamily hydrolase